MQCFPTLPTPPLSPPSSLPPSPSSLLCTVDDSDPGQSSETWGERLVPPCRIYAGNRCSPILSPPLVVLLESRSPTLHYYAAVNTHTHMHVCVFSDVHPPLGSAHACLCLVTIGRRRRVGGPRRAVCTSENAVLSFSNLMLVICFSVCSTDTRGGGKTMSLMIFELLKQK